MKKKTSKSLRIGFLLVSTAVAFMVIVMPFIKAQANREMNSAYVSVQENPEMYQSSTELLEQVLYSSQLFNIDMLSTIDGNRDLINSIIVDGDKLTENEVSYVISSLKQMQSYNNVYNTADYYVQQNDTGLSYGNAYFKKYLNAKMPSSEDNAWYLSFSIDDKGYVSELFSNAYNSGISNLYKQQASLFIDDLQSEINALTQTENTQIQLRDLKNVSFVIVLSQDQLKNSISVSDVIPGQFIEYNWSSTQGDFILCFLITSIILFIVAYLFPIRKMQESTCIQKCLNKKGLLISLIVYCASFILMNNIYPELISNIYLYLIPFFIPLMYVLLTATALFGFMLKKIRNRKKLEEQEEKEVWVYHMLYTLDDKIFKMTHYLTTINLSEKSSKQIIFITICNMLALLIIVAFSLITGFSLLIFVFTGIYSLFVFFVMHRVLRKIRGDYEILSNIILRTACGERDGEIEENLGVFNTMKDSLQHLQDDFHTAVEQEVQSQKMKTELITNVSHDLKTPLTSIISYIDLLKDEKISEEERSKYLGILDNSADRLKHLIENLFEISKANSGNVDIECMDVDIISLIKQVEMECESAFQKKKLTLRYQHQDEKVIVSLDSQKTYRIFENLMGNVGKYAMNNTRVYVQVQDFGNMVEVSIKNMSETELDFDPEEIMERFTRGDKSRNSDGSGLGLAIAKSFTELQNGMMKIVIDGDLFKVILRFYRDIEGV